MVGFPLWKLDLITVPSRSKAATFVRHSGSRLVPYRHVLAKGSLIHLNGPDDASPDPSPGLSNIVNTAESPSGHDLLEN